MKLFLAILTVALVAQVSSGASIQQAKRNADDSSMNLTEFLKGSMSILKTKLEGVYMEIPDTAAFDSYNKEFEEIIDLIVENKGDRCLVKFGKVSRKFSDLCDENDNDESAEGRIINELVVKFFTDGLLEKYDNDFKNAKPPSLQEFMVKLDK